MLLLRVLLLSLLLLAGASAPALNLSTDHSGQVLIFPYYTVRAGHSTLISIHNPTRSAKALRLRFREAANGRSVLELNLYLAAHDVWSAFVSQHGSNEPAYIATRDSSCTYPELRDNPALPLVDGARRMPFSRRNLVGALTDAGGTDAVRTHDGFIEIIEMGVVGNGTGAGARRSLDAIGQAAQAGPERCQQIRAAWDEGSADPYWRRDPSTDLLPPTRAHGGGLSGAVAIVQVDQGVQFAMQPEAIEGFSVSILHHPPETEAPTLAHANFPTASGASTQIVIDGRVQTLHYSAENAIDAVSALFTRNKIHNEFATIQSESGATVLGSEWLLTMPTKHFYVDAARGLSHALPPFDRLFPRSATVENRDARVDVFLSKRYHDTGSHEWPWSWTCIDSWECNSRQSGWPGPSYILPPSSVGGQVSSLVFDNDPYGYSVLQSSKQHRVFGISGPGKSSGQLWIRLFHPTWMDWVTRPGAPSPWTGYSLDDQILRPDLAGRRLAGVPVIGFRITRTEIAAEANFGGLWRLRGSRCLLDEAQSPLDCLQ